jgi:adenylosuccinate synthase
VRVASHLGYFGRAYDRLDVLVGAQYGSEGKGNIAAYLASAYEVLVRVGGPNAPVIQCLNHPGFVGEQLM